MKLLLIFALVACGSRSPQPPRDKTGAVGAVCGCGEDTKDACVAVACQPGLTCGYPCGIRGCDSVCMTREDFEATPNNL